VNVNVNERELDKKILQAEWERAFKVLVHSLLSIFAQLAN
jgi:hypothetical protein